MPWKLNYFTRGSVTLKRKYFKTKADVKKFIKKAKKSKGRKAIVQWYRPIKTLKRRKKK